MEGKKKKVFYRMDVLPSSHQLPSVRTRLIHNPARKVYTPLVTAYDIYKYGTSQYTSTHI